VQADAWRQTELARARKQIEKGQDIESVLESLSVGVMKKMLNGPLRELHHAEGAHRKHTLETVRHMFLNT
jgi:glutamyl-tRNA reductase